MSLPGRIETRAPSDIWTKASPVGAVVRRSPVCKDCPLPKATGAPPWLRYNRPAPRTSRTVPASGACTEASNPPNNPTNQHSRPVMNNPITKKTTCWVGKKCHAARPPVLLRGAAPSTTTHAAHLGKPEAPHQPLAHRAVVWFGVVPALALGATVGRAGGARHGATQQPIQPVAAGAHHQRCWHPTQRGELAVVRYTRGSHHRHRSAQYQQLEHQPGGGPRPVADLGAVALERPGVAGQPCRHHRGRRCGGGHRCLWRRGHAH